MLVRHDRQADRRRLHAQRHRHVGDGDGAVDPRSERTRRRHRARRVQVRSFHRWPRRIAGGETRLHRRADVGRTDGKQVQLIQDFRPTYHDHRRTARDRRGDAAAGPDRARRRCRSASSAPSRGRRDAHGDRVSDGHRCDRHLRTVRVIGPGVAQGASRRRMVSPSGRTTSPEIVDPQTQTPCCRRVRRASCATSLTKEAMPIVRYRTRDLTRLLPGTARTMRRMKSPALRRHDHPRSTCSDADRGRSARPAACAAYQVEIAPAQPRRIAVWSSARRRRAARTVTRSPASARDTYQNLIGVSATVRVMPSGSIERSIGKAKRVVDKRDMR